MLTKNQALLVVIYGAMEHSDGGYILFDVNGDMGTHVTGDDALVVKNLLGINDTEALALIDTIWGGCPSAGYDCEPGSHCVDCK